MPTLSDNDRKRFARNILLPHFGEEGQLKLRSARILIIGAGGLGSPVAYYLTAAGIGHIGIMDYDTVDISNLQRQILHTTPDIGRPKVQSALEKLTALNPNVDITTYQYPLTSANALTTIAPYDFIIDATDNMDAKYLINDACVLAHKPFSHGGILAYEGQTLTHTPGHACLRCLYGDKPAPGSYHTTSQIGVLGAIAGNIGSLQALEAIKYITGIGPLLTDQLLRLDGLSLSYLKMNIRRSTHCPICGDNPTITSLS